MTMKFRTVKAAIVTLLGNASAGKFRTVGFQPQGESAEQNLNDERSVQVFFSEGTFPKSSASIQGPYDHSVKYDVWLTVSKASEGDLSALENPASTDGERATALAAFELASPLADESLDELIELVFQIIMEADNIDLGLSVGIATNRWIGKIEKDQPTPRGRFVSITALMPITCNMSEEVTGLIPTAGEEIDLTLQVKPVDGTQLDSAKAGYQKG